MSRFLLLIQCLGILASCGTAEDLISISCEERMITEVMSQANHSLTNGITLSELLQAAKIRSAGRTNRSDCPLQLSRLSGRVTMVRSGKASLFGMRISSYLNSTNTLVLRHGDMLVFTPICVY